MTEAMPFLRKPILLSYDPRPCWLGIFYLWSGLQGPKKIFQFQAAAHCGPLGEEKHGDGVGLPLVGDQVGVVALDGGDCVKNRLQMNTSFPAAEFRQYIGRKLNILCLQNSRFFPILEGEIPDRVSQKEKERGMSDVR